MAVLLGDKNVGDIVKIKEGGVAKDYLIIHKGNPYSEMYDSSCNGVWLLRKQAYGSEYSIYQDTQNYSASKLHSYLNSTYLNTIDSNIRSAIKTVKIPWADRTTINSGSNGLSCKVFLLSVHEIGCSLAGYQEDMGCGMPNDGVQMQYFPSGNSYNIKRECRNEDNTVIRWFTRTPESESATGIWAIINTTKMGISNPVYVTSFDEGGKAYLRPAFILPTTISVDDAGNVLTNTAPSITSDSSGDLGTLTDGFDLTYSVNDADNDAVTVTETFDSTQLRSYKAVLGQQEAYSLRGNDWIKAANGSHTFNISATDGKETATRSVTFTRSCKKLAAELAEPMEADDMIRFCSLVIDGAFPTDAILTCEVTNNALDDQPVWEDCTLKVRVGLAYTFKNNFAEKGFAFSFRVTIERGGSGTGGYITKVSGGFE